MSEGAQREATAGNARDDPTRRFPGRINFMISHTIPEVSSHSTASALASAAFVGATAGSMRNAPSMLLHLSCRTSKGEAGALRERLPVSAIIHRIDTTGKAVPTVPRAGHFLYHERGCSSGANVVADFLGDVNTGTV